MKRHNRAERPVDLGAASKRTQGTEGKFTDLVGMMEHWGISSN